MQYDKDTDSSIMLKKANTLLKRGNVKDALSLYADMIAQEPDNPLVYYNMGVAFIEKEDYDLAKQVFSHCLNLGFKQNRVYIGLGICSLGLSSDDEAIEYFDRILPSQENYKEALIGKVYAYINKNDSKNAICILKELKEIQVWSQELSLLEKKAKMIAVST